ncbi:MAG: putative peptidoglycan binding domain-containing protein [Terriglobales bacterium]
MRNHVIFHKPLACVGILLLGAGFAGATTRSAQPKNSSHRKSSAVPSRRQNAHLAVVSAKSSKKTKKVKGQQVIQGDRAREIQTALTREGYMKGEPSGVWDESTRDAMTRYQADHGWQTKTLPDSRALIQLGLGPSHKDAINASAVSANLPPQAPPVKNSAVSENRQ